MVSYDEILTVHMVARYGSFAMAATRLHKVPSAISYKIRKIEEMLQVSLFVRNSKKVTLTPAGRHFIKKSKFILDDIDDLSRETRIVHSGIDPTFKIAVNNILNRKAIVPFVKAFTEQFPTIDLFIETEVYNGTWDILYRRQADLVIGAPHTAPNMEGIICEEMGSVPWDFVVAQDHPLAQCTHPLTTPELRAHTAICVRDTSVETAPQSSWLLEGQKVVYAPDLAIMIRMIQAGIGIAYLPHHKVADLLDQGALIKKPVVEHKTPTTVFVAWRENPNSTALNWVCEFLSKPEIKASWL